MISSIPPPQPSTRQPGEVIDGKYRCEEVLGVGGMGEVVKATHLLRQAQVALKFMNARAAAKPDLVERFLNEAVAASRIESEHVVRVFDVGRTADGTPYMVMEYLEGEELAALLAREGRPGLASLPRAVHLVLQVLRALQAAHEAGVVHRDMKPSNCLVVAREGEPDVVKLFDFGISKLEQPDGTDAARLTRTHALLGTPLYMAPEQARSARRADARTDLYATGVILYELLTGRTPFRPEEDGLAGLFALLLSTDPPLLRSLRADVPEGLAAAVHRALAREPGERFQSAAEMAEALAPYADARSAEVLRRIRQRAATYSRGAPGAPAALAGPVGAAQPTASDSDATVALPRDAGPPRPPGEVPRTATEAATPLAVVHTPAGGAPGRARRGRARLAYVALAGIAVGGVAVGASLGLGRAPGERAPAAMEPTTPGPPASLEPPVSGATAPPTSGAAGPATASASASASAAPSGPGSPGSAAPQPPGTAPRPTGAPTVTATSGRVPLGSIGIER
ncbi:MAG: protein kinase [Myxococcales bacterium]|nr:protein kinase [Myxococcales bacterium]